MVDVNEGLRRLRLVVAGALTLIYGGYAIGISVALFPIGEPLQAGLWLCLSLGMILGWLCLVIGLWGHSRGWRRALWFYLCMVLPGIGLGCSALLFPSRPSATGNILSMGFGSFAFITVVWAIALALYWVVNGLMHKPSTIEPTASSVPRLLADPPTDKPH